MTEMSQKVAVSDAPRDVLLRLTAVLEPQGIKESCHLIAIKEWSGWNNARNAKAIQFGFRQARSL